MMNYNGSFGTFTKKASRMTIKVFKLLFIIGICYLFLFPILNVVITAFRPIEVAQDPTAIWIPRGFSLEGIKVAIKALHYWKSSLLTVIIVIGSTLGALVSCSLAGYGLARFKFPGRTATFILVAVTIIVPPQITYSSTYLLYRFFDFSGLLSIFGVSLNLLNTSWVYILPSIFAAGLRNGIFILIFYSVFNGLPIELEEAAKIDGCGTFKIFSRIMLPLAKSSFITVLLFSIVWHWTDYQSSLVYFTDQLKPITAMLSQLQDILWTQGIIESVGQNYYAVRIFLQAGVLITIAPPLILYIFTQKNFTESIERTGLVG